MRTLQDNFKIYCKGQLENEYLFACTRGDLESVKFLLTSLDIKERANINFCNGDALVCASMRGHLEIVKYLLTSKDLNEHINLNVQDDAPFRMACIENQMHVVKYMIFECNIPCSYYIQTYLKHNNLANVEKLFEMRDLTSQLDEEIPVKNITHKKNKI